MKIGENVHELRRFLIMSGSGKKPLDSWGKTLTGGAELEKCLIFQGVGAVLETTP
jgi:hypothetical protein